MVTGPPAPVAEAAPASRGGVRGAAGPRCPQAPLPPPPLRPRVRDPQPRGAGPRGLPFLPVAFLGHNKLFKPLSRFRFLPSGGGTGAVAEPLGLDGGPPGSWGPRGLAGWVGPESPGVGGVGGRSRKAPGGTEPQCAEVEPCGRSGVRFPGGGSHGLTGRGPPARALAERSEPEFAEPRGEGAATGASPAPGAPPEGGPDRTHRPRRTTGHAGRGDPQPPDTLVSSKWYLSPFEPLTDVLRRTTLQKEGSGS